MNYKIISLKLDELKFVIIDNNLNRIVERFKTIKQAKQYIKESKSK